MDIAGEQDANVIQQLQSREQADLLNAVDRLRQENIDADISIPQIVVCGDQSSGKSALLEAIAQIAFPSGTSMTTLFATELVLRRSPVKSIKVGIEPSLERDGTAIAHLRAFKPDSSHMTAEDFPNLHLAATKYLEEFDKDRGMWNDRLRVEITGPDQPHLTLVDLPGLVHASLNQRRFVDKSQIKSLVKRYIKSPRTIILAVISAKYDHELQEIVNMVKASDDIRQRTLGVITHPDLVSGVDATSNTIDLALNRRLSVGLGWHVVKNLSHDAEDRSSEARDREEHDLLTSTPWSRIARNDVGIMALRRKLGQNLLTCIKKDLPDLMREMQQQLAVRKALLMRLGPGRETPDEHRRYLTGIAGNLKQLVSAALEGQYNVSDFASFFDGSESKGLRDRINSICDVYSTRMRQEGHQYQHWDESHASNKKFKSADRIDFAPSFQDPTGLAGAAEDLSPVNINIRNYCKCLASYMQSSRGKNLPGVLGSHVIQSVFRQQALHWGAITHDFAEKCFYAAFELLRPAVEFVAGPHTAHKLWEAYIDPACETKHASLKRKVDELLWPFQKSHPITYNNRYQAMVDAGASQGGIRNWGQKCAAAQFDREMVAAAHVLDHAQVYYDIALDNLIENVTTLAIEYCLLHELPNIVTPETIADLDEQQLEELGAEEEDEREERERTTAQVSVLEDVIRICRLQASAYHGATFNSSSPPSIRVYSAETTGNRLPATPSSRPSTQMSTPAYSTDHDASTPSTLASEYSNEGSSERMSSRKGFSYASNGSPSRRVPRLGSRSRSGGSTYKAPSVEDGPPEPTVFS